MSELLPRRTPQASIANDPGTLTLTLEDPATETLLATCSSAGGRSVVQALQEAPSTASGIADGVDTSLQNVQYHLERLEAAGLVDVVATDISRKGREMDVLDLAGDPIVLVVDE